MRLFWWAPLHQRGVLISQARQHGPSWAYSARSTGRPFTNFGDELSRLVVADATGAQVEWATPESADHVAIGSVLGRFGMRSEMPWVLGAGLIAPPDGATVHLAQRSAHRFLAVRGPITATALGLRSDTVLADPGLLAMRLVGDKSRHRQGSLVIPHFQAWGTPDGRRELRRARSAGFRVIHPSSKPMSVLKAIAMSDMVLSSSLHGVIVAHSLGVPVDLLSIPGGHETRFKYDDYFESIGRTASFHDLKDYLQRPHLEERMNATEHVASEVLELAHAKADQLVSLMRSASR